VIPHFRSSFHLIWILLATHPIKEMIARRGEGEGTLIGFSAGVHIYIVDILMSVLPLGGCRCPPHHPDGAIRLLPLVSAAVRLLHIYFTFRFSLLLWRLLLLDARRALVPPPCCCVISRWSCYCSLCEGFNCDPFFFSPSLIPFVMGPCRRRRGCPFLRALFDFYYMGEREGRTGGIYTPSQRNKRRPI
jgi:hypothetical protein